MRASIENFSFRKTERSAYQDSEKIYMYNFLFRY